MADILPNIKNPDDLRQLDNKSLIKLAAEIRDEMISTVSRTGGHLAPNLGVVELTIALHKMFNSPRDRFVFDVGHQSYVHKLLTGRQEAFETLRQYRGLSGFPKFQESPHDAFNTGHSSTSISAATGIALARDQQKKDYHVVAVIGDGALTGGMAYESLNHAGHLGTNLIVILNDNEMSIASNVGAMSGYLSRMRSDPMYYKGKEDIENLLKRLPSVGSRVLKVMERVKDSLKYLVVPGMLFEELGFTYLGPVDGHNFTSLKSVLSSAKSIKGPVLVHVLTTKGKGYQPAEENPDQFHGIGPFNIESGKTVKTKGAPSYTQVFSDALRDIARENDKVIAVTAAMPGGTGIDAFGQEFPDRTYDVGIAEQHAVTMSAGLAAGGYKPVVAIYSTFLQRAYDQVLHDVALQKLPVVFALDRAGIVGDDGETHQGLFDFAYLRNIPGLTIMAPKDENELRHMLYTAVEHNEPISLRYPRGSGIGVTMEGDLQQLPIGRGEVLRDGTDITIVAIGNMVHPSLEAAEKLALKGVSAAVINARFVKPLDEDLILKQIDKTGKVVTVEEHVLAGGFGSAVLEMLAKHSINADVSNIAVPDEFVQQGSQSMMRAKYGLDAPGISRTVVERFFPGINLRQVRQRG
ncbi:1-deoxy-D-xylulose-5-phosphate synthase [Metallumcola ferriviriculae]|uniref:1-deoxy-D-xylulose-5-phosphate synthase n=1 Tax=Metallumcola ferriviriculae TaxID=3039180 RepID=UPI00345A7016